MQEECCCCVLHTACFLLNFRSVVLVVKSHLCCGWEWSVEHSHINHYSTWFISSFSQYFIPKIMLNSNMNRDVLWWCCWISCYMWCCKSPHIPQNCAMWSEQSFRHSHSPRSLTLSMQFHHYNHRQNAQHHHKSFSISPRACRRRCHIFESFRSNYATVASCNRYF